MKTEVENIRSFEDEKRQKVYNFSSSYILNFPIF